MMSLPVEVEVAKALIDDSAFITIRGVRLSLDELIEPRLADLTHLDELRSRMQSASPYPHLVVQDWFNPRLLELVREEFEVLPRDNWSTQTNAYARVERSRVGARMGPASQLYFWTIGSSFFLHALSHISGVADLVSDAHLFGGGLHETLSGAPHSTTRWCSSPTSTRTGSRRGMARWSCGTPAASSASAPSSPSSAARS
jgi:hypothetical protein